MTELINCLDKQYWTMPQHTWLVIGGSVILPNIGGFLGGFITRSQIKDWFDKGIYYTINEQFLYWTVFCTCNSNLRSGVTEFRKIQMVGNANELRET